MIDDVDVLLNIHPHGWSSCTFIVADRRVTVLASSIFGEPFSLLISSLSALIRKAPEATFDWNDEPGGHRFTFSAILPGDKIRLQVYSFGEANNPAYLSEEPVLVFELPLRQWIILYGTQLKKLDSLLQDKAYARNRQSFPFKAFREFESLVIPYFS